MNSPAVAINSDGRLDVFVIGSGDNGLWHKWQTEAGQYMVNWESLGGTDYWYSEQSSCSNKLRW